MNNNKSLFDGMIVFCAVVENNGFSAAARKLATTPSYVSKEIARLEHRLNARLLNRTTRKVSMTDAGRHYYERARQIVEDAQSAENQAISASSKPSGLLKISVPVSFSLSYLNNWLPEFLRAYPDIRLDIEASDRMADIVSEGFDVVVRAGRLDDSELVAKRLTSSRMMVVAAPGYLQNAGTPRHPDDLKDHVLIDFSRRHVTNRWDFAGKNGKRISVSVSPQVVCNSAETEQALAIAGVGITGLPSFTCEPALASGALVPVLEEFEKPAISIYAIYPNRAHLSAKVRVFVDFLVGKFGSY